MSPNWDGTSCWISSTGVSRLFPRLIHSLTCHFPLAHPLSLFPILTALSPISDEAYYMRPDALRHPLIFYYGHTAVLYINKLVTAQVLTDRVNEQYESMLAVGVDEMSWDDLNETSYEWPTVADVKKYRDTVRAIVDRLIRTLPLQFPITWTSPWWIILLGIEHERIHLETSSVLIRQLPINQACRAPVLNASLWTRSCFVLLCVSIVVLLSPRVDVVLCTKFSSLIRFFSCPLVRPFLFRTLAPRSPHGRWFNTRCGPCASSSRRRARRSRATLSCRCPRVTWTSANRPITTYMGTLTLSLRVETLIS